MTTFNDENRNTPYHKLEWIHFAIQEAMNGNIEELNRALPLVEDLREDLLQKIKESEDLKLTVAAQAVIVHDYNEQQSELKQLREATVTNIVRVKDKAYVTIRYPDTDEHYGYTKIMEVDMEDVMLAESFGADEGRTMVDDDGGEEE